MTTLNLIIEEYSEILKNRCEMVHLSQIFSELQVNSKVSFAYDLLNEDNFLPKLTKVSTKSVAAALQYRNLGNEAFCRKRDIDALKYYTKSVAASPKDSEELALAYANRSAVLFKLQRYTSSLLDINRALKNNYPDALKQKLYSRKSSCMEKMKNENNPESINSSFSKLLIDDNSGVRGNRTQDREFEEDGTDLNFDEKFNLPAVNFKNVTIPNASEKIKINFSEEMGRHLVATVDIDPCEILAIEKPYASILLPEFNYTHCSHCFVRTESLIPCNNCSLIMFCGEHCREEATNLYHKIECQIMPFMLSLELGKMELLALRILLIATKQGKQLRNLMTHPLYRYPIIGTYSNSFDRYISEDYFTVHNLEDNFTKRSVSDVFMKSAVAAIILHVLKLSSFFYDSPKRKCPDSDKLTKNESFVGTLLLKYLFSVPSNAHEISELIEDNILPESKIIAHLEIGAALYPLLSLTNHSCDPNVVRHSHKDSIVFRSIQPITAGEQLFDNYGYHYAIHSLPERQNHLKIQYFFECNCIPCKLDWPLHEKLSSEDPEFLTDIINKEKLKENSLKFKHLLRSPLDFNKEDLINFCCEYLSMLHKSIRRPWKEYNECQEVIKRIMAKRANHYVLASDVIL